MQKTLSALVGVSMLGLAAMAQAAEPMFLTDTEMDTVRAGQLPRLPERFVEVLEDHVEALAPEVLRLISSSPLPERRLERLIKQVIEVLEDHVEALAPEVLRLISSSPLPERRLERLIKQEIEVIGGHVEGLAPEALRLMSKKHD